MSGVQPLTDLRKEDWEIRDISQKEALALIRAYHYAGNGPNTASYRHGLFSRGSDIPVGVALWLPPPPQGAKSAAIDAGIDDWHKVISLSRLAIAPEVPSGAASYLVGRSMRRIRRDRRYSVALTFADEYQGHEGAIYRATNWTYMGLTKPYWTWVDDNGILVSKKMGPTNRSAAQMESLGYHRLGPHRKHRFLKKL